MKFLLQASLNKIESHLHILIRTDITLSREKVSGLSGQDSILRLRHKWDIMRGFWEKPSYIQMLITAVRSLPEFSKLILHMIFHGFAFKVCNSFLSSKNCTGSLRIRLLTKTRMLDRVLLLKTCASDANQTTMRYHLTCVRMSIIKKRSGIQCWWEYGEKGTL